MLELKEVRYSKTIDNSLKNDGELLFNFLKHQVEQHEIECVKTIATLYDDNTNVLCVKEYEGYSAESLAEYYKDFDVKVIKIGELTIYDGDEF